MKNVILLDDHPIILQRLSLLLEKSGRYNVAGKFQTITEVESFLNSAEGKTFSEKNLPAQ